MQRSTSSSALSSLASSRRAHAPARDGRVFDRPSDAVHLVVLSAFALAQPLFDLLGRNAEFFAVRGSTRLDIVLFALALTFVPAAILFTAEVLAGVVDTRLRRALHLVFVTGLVALIALQALKRIGDSSSALLVAGAVILGGAVAVASSRIRFVRSFLTVLAPAPFVFLALFLLGSPVAKLLRPADAEARVAHVSADAPVVVVVFDAFLGTALMDERHRVDADRYPNFARLARDSTWFRNTTSVHDQTTFAVPAILTGKRPQQGKLPLFSDHPDNLFTLLGGSYRVKAFEPVTHLCPDAVCKEREERKETFGKRMRSLVSDVSLVYLHVLLPDDVAARFPAVTETWGNFRQSGDAEKRERKPTRKERKRGRFLKDRPPGEFIKDRAALFEAFVSSIRRTDGPRTLYFVHVVLPHFPFSYLPSGKEYGNAEKPFGTTRRGWADDPWFVTQQYRRYLFQVRFADRLLGDLLARLRATGLYDRSLLVVTSDHGMSFRPNEPSRAARETNVHEVAPVPLFVKAPGQRRGRVVDRNAATVDVLPTIADALGVRVSWKTDGRSALDGNSPDRRRIVMESGAKIRIVTDAASFRRRKDEALARWLSIFRADKDSLGFFRVGPHQELLGKRVAALAAGEESGIRAELEGEDDLRSVDVDSAFVPVHVAGRLAGSGAEPGLPLAVAVNGRIAAVTPSVPFFGGTWFAALVPESVLHDGANEVDVFLISSEGGSTTLERLGGTGG